MGNSSSKTKVKTDKKSKKSKNNKNEIKKNATVAVEGSAADATNKDQQEGVNPKSVATSNTGCIGNEKDNYLAPAPAPSISIEPPQTQQPHTSTEDNDNNTVLEEVGEEETSGNTKIDSSSATDNDTNAVDGIDSSKATGTIATTQGEGFAIEPSSSSVEGTKLGIESKNRLKSRRSSIGSGSADSMPLDKKRRPSKHTKVYLMDGSYRALNCNSTTTVLEVIVQIIDRVDFPYTEDTDAANYVVYKASFKQDDIDNNDDDNPIGAETNTSQDGNGQNVTKIVLDMNAVPLIELGNSMKNNREAKANGEANITTRLFFAPKDEVLDPAELKKILVVSSSMNLLGNVNSGDLDLSEIKAAPVKELTEQEKTVAKLSKIGVNPMMMGTAMSAQDILASRAKMLKKRQERTGGEDAADTSDNKTTTTTTTTKVDGVAEHVSYDTNSVVEEGNGDALVVTDDNMELKDDKLPVEKPKAKFHPPSLPAKFNTNINTTTATATTTTTATSNAIADDICDEKGSVMEEGDGGIGGLGNTDTVGNQVVQETITRVDHDYSVGDDLNQVAHSNPIPQAPKRRPKPQPRPHPNPNSNPSSTTNTCTDTETTTDVGVIDAGNDGGQDEATPDSTLSSCRNGTDDNIELNGQVTVVVKPRAKFHPPSLPTKPLPLRKSQPKVESETETVANPTSEDNNKQDTFTGLEDQQEDGCNEQQELEPQSSNSKAATALSTKTKARPASVYSNHECEVVNCMTDGNDVQAIGNDIKSSIIPRQVQKRPILPKKPKSRPTSVYSNNGEHLIANDMNSTAMANDKDVVKNTTNPTVTPSLAPNPKSRPASVYTNNDKELVVNDMNNDMDQDIDNETVDSEKDEIISESSSLPVKPKGRPKPKATATIENTDVDGQQGISNGYVDGTSDNDVQKPKPRPKPIKKIRPPPNMMMGGMKMDMSVLANEAKLKIDMKKQDGS